MIRLVNMICDGERRRSFEQGLRSTLPLDHIELVSPEQWAAHSKRSTIMFFQALNPHSTCLLEKQLTPWIVAYDDSSFSNYVFSKRHSILARDTFFVVYAPTHYLENNKAFLEQLAKEKLCKFFLPDEIHRHIFLIDSETGDGFGCLVVALQDQQTTAK